MDASSEQGECSRTASQVSNSPAQECRSQLLTREVRYLRAGFRDVATEKHPMLYTGAVEASAAVVLPLGNNRRSTETVFRWGKVMKSVVQWSPPRQRPCHGPHTWKEGRLVNIEIHTLMWLWVSAHRKLARLPSELRTASVSDCFSWPEKSCAKPLLQKRTSNSPATPKGEQN